MAMTGTVKFFNGERKDLTEGQRITFEVEPDKKGKGPKAVNLVVA